MQFSVSNSILNSWISSSEETASIIHIWGDDIGVGKSTLCYVAALEKLAKGQKVVFISTKSYFNTQRFQQLKQNYQPFDPYNFLLYHPSTFSQQTEIVMNLEFLFLEEIKKFNKTNIGLIILDGASILRHLEMKSEPQNQKTLRVFSTIIASLDYLRITYEIPILVSNRSVIRIKDNQNVVQPASNAVMQYWGKISLKLQRTEDPSIRRITLERHPEKQNLPIQIDVKLSDNGFI